jgi:3,4-dihydroxy 2-butanone 4-phosphate synthase/GTP cyclohydrolase II
LGIKSMRLLTNNPDKRVGLEGYGLKVVDRVPLPVWPNPENLRYLRTKRDRMGHDLHHLEQYESDSVDPLAGSSIDTDSDGAQR